MKAIKVDLFRKILVSMSLILICHSANSQTRIVNGVVTMFHDVPVVNAEITAKNLAMKPIPWKTEAFPLNVTIGMC